MNTFHCVANVIKNLKTNKNKKNEIIIIIKRELHKMEMSHMSHLSNLSNLSISSTLSNKRLLSFKNIKVCHHKNDDKVHKVPKVAIPHLHHLCSTLSPHKSPHSYDEIKHFFPSH